jgi:hypothetical protein
MKWNKLALVFFGMVAVSIALMMGDRSSAQDAGRESNGPAKSEAIRAEESMPPSGDSASIGYFQTRNKIIVISCGPKGSLYTIKDKDGRTLAAKLSGKDFQSKYPELYDQIKDGVAGNDATLRIKSFIQR